MSFLSLLQQTGMTATWTRKVTTGLNSYREQITTPVVMGQGIPCRKQVAAEEYIQQAGMPTEIGGIKWHMYLPITYQGTDLDIKQGDIVEVYRGATPCEPGTYYNVITTPDAVSELHHYELLLEQVTQVDASQ
jgi:hypothetical protein